MTSLGVIPPRDYVGAVESVDLIADAVAPAASSPALPTTSTATSTSRCTATRGSAVSATSTTTPCSRSSPSAAATPSGRARSTRSTACSGRPRGRVSRRGTPATALPAGRPGWHLECAAIALDRLGSAVRRAGRRHRPGLPAPRDERLGGAGPDRRVAVRPALRARRDGRARRREDVEVQGQPGLRLGAAPRRARPDGGPARAARPPLPHRLVLDRAGPDRRRGAAGPLAGRRRHGRPGRRPTTPSTRCAGTSPTTSTHPARSPRSTGGSPRRSTAGAPTRVRRESSAGRSTPCWASASTAPRLVGRA